MGSVGACRQREELSKIGEVAARLDGLAKSTKAAEARLTELREEVEAAAKASKRGDSQPRGPASRISIKGWPCQAP